VTPPPISATSLSTAPATWEDTLTARFVGALLAAYEDETVRYAVLRNYERFPEDFGKDVDLVVHENDVALSHQIVVRLARAFGLHWTVRSKRSGHRTYYLLPAPVDGAERGFLLDVRTDLVHQGLTYLPGAMVLAGRRRFGAFYVPSPAIESLGILLHAVIDAGTIRDSYRDRLLALRTGDRAEFLAAASAVVGPRLAQKLAEALAGGEPRSALALRTQLIRACALRNVRAAGRWLACRSGAAFDKVRAFFRPPGQLIICLGPDGAGKTTLSTAICARLAATRITASSVYLGAQKPLLPTRKLSQQLHKRFDAPGKVKPIKDVNRRQRLRGLVHIMADKWARYLIQVRPRLVRGEVVVLDRYFYDLRVFPHPLVQTPWMDALIMRLIPEPAIAFCLRADPALIAARKHELTTAETARQIELYRGLRHWVRNFHEVPADGHMPTVIDWTTEQVVRAYAARRSPERI